MHLGTELDKETTKTCSSSQYVVKKQGLVGAGLTIVNYENLLLSSVTPFN